jgi:hypothetical protein
MEQVIVFVLFILSTFWSGYFFYSPLAGFWGTIFTDCQNGFSYDQVSGRCNCQIPFNGTYCDIDLCVNGKATLGSFGWECQCKDLWTGAFCDVCGTYDQDECKAPVPYPNGNKCRTEVVADGLEVEFLGSDCDLICIKAKGVRSFQGAASETYQTYLAKSPLNVPRLSATAATHRRARRSAWTVR